ncbi:putative glutathione S-transferase [Sesbania bispinosa]|nr:putative glutathione S-transferase [Sesbania bispinosa]
MGQYGLNFNHSPQPNLAMHSGSSRGAIGGEGTNEQAQTPVASIAESEVPPKSFGVGLENIVINKEQILGGRTRPKARFTMEEDTLLIQSWLNVSKDAIVGIDQKESFWRRVRHNYNEYRGEHQERGPIALKSCWQKLNAAVQKFVGCYKQAIGAKKSGTTENDVINHALSIFRRMKERHSNLSMHGGC